MSECQVSAVGGLEKSMMEPLESMKEGGRGEGGREDRVGIVREWRESVDGEEEGINVKHTFRIGKRRQVLSVVPIVAERQPQ